MSDVRAAAVPKISILTLTYDRSQRIGAAIESAREQSFTDWELILVQDGNHPETTERCREWAAREPRIRYYPRGILGSIAEASNFGLTLACGTYVAILDDDDRWSDPEQLARQAQFLDANPDHVACAGGYSVVGENGQTVGSYLKPENDGAVRARALIANPVAKLFSFFCCFFGGLLVRFV